MDHKFHSPISQCIVIVTGLEKLSILNGVKLCQFHAKTAAVIVEKGYNL
jgi:hypothetical protein